MATTEYSHPSRALERCLRPSENTLMVAPSSSEHQSKSANLWTMYLIQAFSVDNFLCTNLNFIFVFQLNKT